VTAKQQRFVEEYLIDLNGTAAAIRAGYAPKAAFVTASKLLSKSNPNTCVRAGVDKALAERSKRTGICADRVVEELAKIALINPEDLLNLDTATVKGDAQRYDKAAIQAVRVKETRAPDGSVTFEREVKLADKNKALDMLMRHVGAYAKDRGDAAEGGPAVGVVIMPGVAAIESPPPVTEQRADE
jgi:phage terminase small subunit